MATGLFRTLGRRVAPVRFLVFLALLPVASLGFRQVEGSRHAWMLGFDVAGIVFLLSCLPLLRKSAPSDIRRQAVENDANRVLLLGLTGIITAAVLATVAAEIETGPKAASPLLVIGTLATAWLVGNAIFALHYAHLYYLPEGGGDHGGLGFPATEEPDYWDFVYYAFTIGMTFQTSDVTISSRRIRRATTFHALAAFFYNLGILAFTINLLGRI